MAQHIEARRLAQRKLWRIVTILALTVIVFGVARRATGATILPNLTDSEILGILAGLVVGALGVLWWLQRRT